MGWWVVGMEVREDGVPRMAEGDKVSGIRFSR